MTSSQDQREQGDLAATELFEYLPGVRPPERRVLEDVREGTSSAREPAGITSDGDALPNELASVKLAVGCAGDGVERAPEAWSALKAPDDRAHHHEPWAGQAGARGRPA